MKTLLLHGLMAFAVLWAGESFSQLYTFSTVAGAPGLSGASDGTNDQARFNFPVGIALDTHGAVYVCDQLNNTVRQLKTDGTNWVVRTLAGVAGVRGYVDGTNDQAQFNRPTGIAVDPAGNVFVSDKYNNTIRKITPVGTNWVVTTIAGQRGVADGQDGTNNGARFYGPAGLALNRSNDLFVADSSNFTIRKIVQLETNWVVTTIAGSETNFGSADGVNGSASFDYPWAVTAAESGTLFVADYGNQLVRKIEPVGADWVTSTVAGVLDIMGTNDGPGYQATFYDLNGIGASHGKTVFVADYGNHTIRGITQSASGWTVSTLGGIPKLAGTNDGIGSGAQFNHPRDVCVDTTGAVFISDYNNHTIRLGVPPPRLDVHRAGAEVLLSWPFWANQYVLEVSSALGSSARWTQVTNVATLSEQMFVLAYTVSGPAFFRLKQQ